MNIGIQELNGAVKDNQAAIQETAEMGGEPAAVRDDSKETPEENDDDDDDAPEEVSMAAGKAGAAQQRQQEPQAAAQKCAAARARVEKRGAVAAEQKADRGTQHLSRQPSSAARRLLCMPKPVWSVVAKLLPCFAKHEAER
ncbi:hypothetical protein COCOBI_13-1430 [Coccomyxa sp. Obi]|nr:hypothetical protein COCOBI_13-1430 [Coccomyxa sp. Obi]